MWRPPLSTSPTGTIRERPRCLYELRCTLIATEERILAGSTIYPFVMAPLLVVMATYTVLERDNGEVLFP